jgi:hypothetical protein
VHSAKREHEEGVDLVIDFPDAPPPIAICPASDWVLIGIDLLALKIEYGY